MTQLETRLHSFNGIHCAYIKRATIGNLKDYPIVAFMWC